MLSVFHFVTPGIDHFEPTAKVRESDARAAAVGLQSSVNAVRTASMLSLSFCFLLNAIGLQIKHDGSYQLRVEQVMRG